MATYIEVIEAIGQMPTQRSEYFVLDHLLKRRQKHGSMMQKLYATLLRAEFAAEVAETDADRRVKALVPEQRRAKRA